MNNGNPSNQHFNLPPPVEPIVEPTRNLPEAESVASAETGPAAAPETAPRPTTALPAMPAPPPTSVSPASAAAASTTSNAPAVADDNDLIEKEWVLKAKQIVEKTRNNPHQQNKELSAFKADYMKKRYNKTIKLSE